MTEISSAQRIANSDHATQLVNEMKRKDKARWDRLLDKAEKEAVKIPDKDGCRHRMAIGEVEYELRITHTFADGTIARGPITPKMARALRKGLRKE